MKMRNLPNIGHGKAMAPVECGGPPIRALVSQDLREGTKTGRKVYVRSVVHELRISICRAQNQGVNSSFYFDLTRVIPGVSGVRANFDFSEIGVHERIIHLRIEVL